MVDLAGDVLGGEPSSRAHPPFHATRNKPKAIQYLRLPYFKLASGFIVLAAILYHIILHATWGNDSCHWLFNFGTFRDFKVWQPWGCMMHLHTSADARMCMRYKHSRNQYNHFVFVGDSRMRQTYRHFANSLQASPATVNWTAETLEKTASDAALIHQNQTYNDAEHGLKVQFLWAPHPDNAIEWFLLKLLAAANNPVAPGSSSLAAEKKQSEINSDESILPGMLMIGMGTWTIKQYDASYQGLMEYEKNLTTIMPLLLQLSERITIVWIFQPPIYAARLHPARRMLSNSQIDMYNEVVEQLLDKFDPNKRIRRCWSLYTIHESVARQESADGLHLGKTTLDYATQLFLNYYCNGEMNYSEATCCTSAEQIHPVQLVSFIVFGLFGMGSIIIWIRRGVYTKCRQRPNADSNSAMRNQYAAVPVTESTVDAVPMTQFPSQKPSFADEEGATVASERGITTRNGVKQNHRALATQTGTTKIAHHHGGIKKKHKRSDVGGSSFELQQLKADHDSPVHNNASFDAVFDEIMPTTFKSSSSKSDDNDNAAAPELVSEAFVPNASHNISSSEAHRPKRPPRFRDFCFGMTRIGLVMTYIFISDRTNFFMKENKYFSYLQFGIPMAYLFVLGMFFSQDSNHVSVLNRDLTDEWKGWMQVVILIYHFTGASRVMPIYMCIRVLVSSYLFLSGYGHFTHFWLYGDYSLYRFISVLFRLNFLVFILCLVMHRYYQFYYFVPLVSFWFCVLYFVMLVPPQVSAASAESNPIHYLYLILKLAAMTGAISVLSMSQVFFDTIFGMKPWRALFVLNSMKNYNIDVSVEEFGYERYSVTEWFFRWHLDRFSMLGGVLMAICYHVLGKPKYDGSFLHDGVAQGSVFGSTNLAITYLTCFGAVLGLGVYGAFAVMCPSKAECNEVHSYFTFIPILAYVVLRNVWGPWRARFSSVFAWLGRISLELFVCQYHIWLAADTHGVFVLIPNSPVLNVTVTGLIFVLVSHEMHEMTKMMHRFFVPRETVPLIRNVLVFLIVMTAIGLSDNMIF